MSKFLVWDADNGDRESAVEINAYDAEFAACEYAEQDCDGNADGIYCHRNEPMNCVAKQGVLVCVVDAESGQVSRFRVGITEFDPVYAAEPAADAEGGPP